MNHRLILTLGNTQSSVRCHWIQLLA